MLFRINFSPNMLTLQNQRFSEIINILLEKNHQEQKLTISMTGQSR